MAPAKVRGDALGKEIALSADFDPRTALDVLKLPLDERDEAGMTEDVLTGSAAPKVIARAIASGDAVLKQDVVAYVDHLGEKGNFSLEAEVEKVLAAAVTSSDVDN